MELEVLLRTVVEVEMIFFENFSESIKSEDRSSWYLDGFPKNVIRGF
jgi:hypothetical protein